MKAILSLGIAAATLASTAADTTVAVLEYGRGGSVRRTTSSSTQSTPAAVASFWNVMHRRTKRSVQHAGMTVVPDLFNQADAGIVIGISGAGADLTSMPTTVSLLGEGAGDVVGHFHVLGQVGKDLMNLADKGIEFVSNKDTFGKTLQSSAEKASRGLEGMETVSLIVDNEAAAKEADEQLRLLLKTVKNQASANGKTVVVHLVFEEDKGASRRKMKAPSSRRRLSEDEDEESEDSEDNEDGDEEDNQNNNNNANYNNAYGNSNYGSSYYNYGYKSMNEIQNFNVITWTAIGLVAVLSMVMGAFINMPLFPDTLLFGETGKMAISD